MEKDYIKDQYKIAKSDFKIAKNENQRWDARKTMAKLEDLAARLYGDVFLKELQELKELKN